MLTILFSEFRPISFLYSVSRYNMPKDKQRKMIFKNHITAFNRTCTWKVKTRLNTKAPDNEVRIKKKRLWRRLSSPSQIHVRPDPHPPPPMFYCKNVIYNYYRIPEIGLNTHPPPSPSTPTFEKKIWIHACVKYEGKKNTGLCRVMHFTLISPYATLPRVTLKVILEV